MKRSEEKYAILIQSREPISSCMAFTFCVLFKASHNSQSAGVNEGAQLDLFKNLVLEST